MAIEEIGTLLQGLWVTFTGSESEKQVMPSAMPDVGRDVPVICTLTVAIFLLNWGIRLLLVSPLLMRFLTLELATRRKFEQSVMELLIYAAFSIIGLRIVPWQPWAWPSSRWWKGYHEGEHAMMRSDLRCYYLMYMARYIQGIISVFLEPKRKDFAAMLCHHSVTVLVIYASYVTGWNRVGVCVMATLDPADVLLHAAKICKYMEKSTKRPSRAWKFMANRIFEMFALTFVVTRLLVYGYICWSAQFEATVYIIQDAVAIVCQSSLWILFCLQVYWFSLLCKAVVQVLSGNDLEDARSDDEDEGQTDGVQREGRKER